MKKAEIVVGGVYIAKVSGKLTNVRIDSIGSDGRFHVTNLATQRRTVFRSAAKFRKPASLHNTVKPIPQPTKVGSSLSSLTEIQKKELMAKATPEQRGKLAKLLGGYFGEEADPLQPQSPPVEEKPIEAVKNGANASTYCPTCQGFGTLRNPSRRCTDCNGSGKKRSDPPIATGAATACPKPVPVVSSVQTAAGDKQGSDPTPAVVKPAPSATATAAGIPALASDKAPTAAPRLSGLAEKLAMAKMAQIAQQSKPLPEGAKVAGYEPTGEQRAILEVAITSGLKSLVIVAGAGTGKTSTLKMLEQSLPGRGQYTAFNASLVAESKPKFLKASCNTTHSLAFRAVGKRFAHRLGGNRIRSEQVASMLGIHDLSIDVGGQEQPKTLTAGFLAGQIMVAIRKFCQSADQEITSSHFRYVDGIDMPTMDGRRGRENNDKVKAYLLPFARKAWEDLSNPNGELPFSHDVYVKVWQLGENGQKPYIAADYILLDEGQDTAPVFLDILQQQVHALLIIVGDDNQQIYDWRGATNAMKAFPKAPRRLLSQSFRFGQRISDVANAILQTLEEPTDLVMRGLPTINSKVEPVSDPNCVLCRTNAAAVATVLKAIDAGKIPHLIGGAEDTVSFVRAARDLKAGRPTRHPELCCFSDWKEVEEYVKTDEGSDLKLMVKLIKEFTCEGILRALEKMPDEKDADLVVSTAHKSKGREWDTVRLAPDFPSADKMADSDRRLLYVAATRAKLVLDISQCPPFIGDKAIRF